MLNKDENDDDDNMTWMEISFTQKFRENDRKKEKEERKKKMEM